MSKKVWAVLIFGWMAVIFLFSSQAGEGSSSLSQWIMGLLPSWMKGDGEGAGLLFGFLPLRKLAHMAEYAVLGLLFLGYFKTEKLPWRKRFLFSWLLSAAYGAADEFHQLFVPGRTGTPVDVAIDSIGAAAGLFLYWAGETIFFRIRGKKENGEETNEEEY